MNFTDIFINKPVLAIVVSLLILVLGMRALGGSCGAPVSEDRERGRHGHDGVLRRGRADHRRLHHAAARAGDRAGAGHRLPVVDERHRRVDDHRDAAPQLRRQPRADADPDAGELGAQPAAAAGAAAGAQRAGRRDDRRDVHGLSQRRAAGQQHHRLSRARGQAQARCDRRACRPPRFSAGASSRCARGSIRRGSPRTASPRPTSTRRSRPTTISPRSAPPRARWSASISPPATDLHSVEEFKQLVDQAEGRRDRAPRGRRQRRARRRGLRLRTSRSAASSRCSSASRSRRTRTSSTSPSACAMRCRTSRRSCRAAFPARSSTTAPSSSPHRSARS